MHLFNTLSNELSSDTKSYLDGLSKEMMLLLLLGLDFPLQHDELILLRFISCVQIHRMYVKRIALQTN